MHGANAPLLQRMIEKEMRKERLVLKGEAVRELIDLEDAVPVKSKTKVASNLWADTDEEDNADNPEAVKKNKDEQLDQQKNFAILAIENHIYEDPDGLPLLKTILEQAEIKIIQVKDVTLTLDDIKFLTSGVKTSEDQFDGIVDKLLEANCKLLMLRAEEDKNASQKLNEILGPLYKDEEAEPPEEKTEKFAKDYAQELAAIGEDEESTIEIKYPEGIRVLYQCREDKTRFPGFLCPDYAGFLGMTENHFFDALASVLNDPNVDCRKVLLIFSEDRKETILKEMEDASLSVIISGSCSDVNGEKASLLVEKGRNTSKMEENERNTLLTQITDVELFAALIKRETEKEKRTEQNDVIIELNPLVVSLHLGSMKIFFNNIKTEEKTADGEYLGELDQGVSSDEEDPPGSQ